MSQEKVPAGVICITQVAYAGCRLCFMAKGCMVVARGHLLNDAKHFGVRGCTRY